MIAYLMKSSERDVFKYWKGGGENSNASGKFELDTIEGFAQVSVSNFKTFSKDHDYWYYIKGHAITLPTTGN